MKMKLRMRKWLCWALMTRLDSKSTLIRFSFGGEVAMAKEDKRCKTLSALKVILCLEMVES